jgi:pimeloyl-ACP methyl ester carboxylesterase
MQRAWNWWPNMLGEGFRVISPSRFGYFGSTLQPTATPADQADAYALLLDHLGIDRAAIIGYSAASASVLEFALRHPNRASVLILANARLGGSTPNRLLNQSWAPSANCSSPSGLARRVPSSTGSSPTSPPTGARWNR